MNDRSAEAFAAIQLDLEDARAFAKTARDQQRTTIEVLRVIRSSAGDSHKVFEKILDACQQLFKLTSQAEALSEAHSRCRSIFSPGGACWVAGQCGAQRPVICLAGLHGRPRGGCVGVGVRGEGRALVSCTSGAAAAHAGLLRGFGDVDLEICLD